MEPIVVPTPLVQLSAPSAIPYSVFFDDSPEHHAADDRLMGVLVPRGVAKTRATPDLSPRARHLWFGGRLHRTYDPLSGISTASLRALSDEFRRRGGCVRSVIFDWDRTLTMHKGMDRAVLWKRGAPECYFGGRARMRALRELFTVLRRRRIRVHLVSTNPLLRSCPLAFTRLLLAVGSIGARKRYVRGVKHDAIRKCLG